MVKITSKNTVKFLQMFLMFKSLIIMTAVLLGVLGAATGAIIVVINVVIGLFARLIEWLGSKQ